MKSLSESFSQPLGTPLAMRFSPLVRLARAMRRARSLHAREDEIIPAGASAAPRKKAGGTASILLPLPGELPLRLVLLRGRRRLGRLLVLRRGDERNVGRLFRVRRGRRRFGRSLLRP